MQPLMQSSSAPSVDVVEPTTAAPPSSPDTCGNSDPREGPPKPLMTLSMDSWTSPSHGAFTSLSARLEEPDGGGVTVSVIPAFSPAHALTPLNQFVIPEVYEDVMTSRSRWEGWLEVLDAPNGLGILPPGITDQQREIMRRLARTLIRFSSQNASAEHEADWAHFIRHLESSAQAEGLRGECQLALVLDWARTERLVSYSFALSMFLLMFRPQESRAWRMRHTAPALNGATANTRHGAANKSRRSVDMHLGAADSVRDVNVRMIEGDGDGDSDCSDMPSLKTVDGSDDGSD